MLLLLIGNLAEVGSQNVEVCLLHNTSIALGILQRYGRGLGLLLVDVGNGNLVAWALGCHILLQFCHLGDLLVVDGSDDVAILKTCIGCCTVRINLVNIYTFVYAEVNFLVLCLL